MSMVKRSSGKRSPIDDGAGHGGMGTCRLRPEPAPLLLILKHLENIPRCKLTLKDRRLSNG